MNRYTKHFFDFDHPVIEHGCELVDTGDCTGSDQCLRPRWAGPRNAGSRQSLWLGEPSERQRRRRSDGVVQKRQF